LTVFQQTAYSTKFEQIRTKFESLANLQHSLQQLFTEQIRNSHFFLCFVVTLCPELRRVLLRCCFRSQSDE